MDGLTPAQALTQALLGLTAGTVTAGLVLAVWWVVAALGRGVRGVWAAARSR